MLSGSFQPSNSAVNQIRRARLIDLFQLSLSLLKIHKPAHCWWMWRARGILGKLTAFQTQIHTDHIKHVSGHFRRPPILPDRKCSRIWAYICWGIMGRVWRTKPEGNAGLLHLETLLPFCYDIPLQIFTFQNRELLIAMGKMFSYYM